VLTLLTEIKVKNAKSKEKDYRIPEGHGLNLLVRAKGAKLWQWRYRFQGKEQVMSFGAYPVVTLAAAREAHTQARRTLAGGVNPMAQKKEEKELAALEAMNPFRNVAAEWFAKWKEGRDEKYIQNTDARLQGDVLSRIGDRPIDQITAQELVKMVTEIEARGASDIARRCLQATSQIFRFGIAHGLCNQNPAAMFKPGDVLKATKVENFKRVELHQLPTLLRKIHFYDGSPVTKLALKLIALVFLRTSELIEGRWSEINWNECRWDVPKERMKGGTRPHIVPLPKQAVEILRDLWHYRHNDEWMFPGERGNSCMSNNTILKALERLGYKGEMTGHGFRGVASTWLHEHGYNSEHIEIQLAHAPDDDVKAAYNYAKYLEPRRKMMQEWAYHLDKMLADDLASSTPQAEKAAQA
jgi:integrase